MNNDIDVMSTYPFSISQFMSEKPKLPPSYSTISGKEFDNFVRAYSWGNG